MNLEYLESMCTNLENCDTLTILCSRYCEYSVIRKKERGSVHKFGTRNSNVHKNGKCSGSKQFIVGVCWSREQEQLLEIWTTRSYTTLQAFFVIMKYGRIFSVPQLIMQSRFLATVSLQYLSRTYEHPKVMQKLFFLYHDQRGQALTSY